MRNWGSSTAIAWLSLFLHLLLQTRISNAETGNKARRNVRNNGDTILLEEIVLARNGNSTKLLGAAAVESPRKVNEQLLSLINGSTDLVFPNYDPSKDQSLAQSQTVLVALDDARDLENLDHVLAFSEYEPQKIDRRKDKRKILDDFSKDQVSGNGQVKGVNPTPLPYLKPYYDVPRGFQPAKRNFYQEGHRPVTNSYQKATTAVNQADLNIPIVNTAAPRRKYTIEDQVSPKIQKIDEGYTLSPLQVPRATYRLPVRRIKNEDVKAKENVEKKIETSAEVSSKPWKGRRRVKSLSIVTVPTVVTTPLSVYNYTVIRKRTNEPKPLLQSATIQPVTVDGLGVSSQTEDNREKLNSRSGSKFSLLKKYDIAPRPFAYTVNHADSVEKPRSAFVIAVTPTNLLPTKENLVRSDLNLKTTPSYDDKVNYYVSTQGNDYKYKKPSSTDRSDQLNDKSESSSEEVSSKADLTSKESDDSTENVEESLERPERRNSYKVSESASLEDDSNSSDESGYSERYEYPSKSKEGYDYFDDYDKRHPRQSQDQKNDHDRSIDVDYEESKQDVEVNDDQDKEGAQNHGHSEKSEDGGDGGHDDGEKKYTKGGKVEQEESHYKKHGKKGEKGYDSWHEHDKATKGHHDKEEHSKEYEEKGGQKKEHEEDGGYHEEYHKDEKGQKEAGFDEKGEHKKGHSTKGEHSVHKKDEYEKKTEFFDEYHEDDDMEKDGEFYTDHEVEHGGKTKSGHHEEAEEEVKHGDLKEHEKTEYHKEKKGKDDEEGKESHYDHQEKYGKKGAHESGKKWMMEQGDKGGQDGGGGSQNGGGGSKDGSGDKNGR